MRYPVEETAAKHERIVKEASRLFREGGFENVTVGKVMKAAGLTHGAFYALFSSIQELQEAAVAYGQGVSARRARSNGATRQGRRAYAERHLSQRRRGQSGRRLHYGRTGAGGGSLDARTKTAFERGLEETVPFIQCFLT